MCMFLSDQMPDLKQYEYTWQKVNALYEYLYGLKNKLNHLLSNIGEENLSQELTETLENIKKTGEELKKTMLSMQAARMAAWPIGTVYLAEEKAKSPETSIGGKWTKMDDTSITGVIAWKRTE